MTSESDLAMIFKPSCGIIQLWEPQGSMLRRSPRVTRVAKPELTLRKSQIPVCQESTTCRRLACPSGFTDKFTRRLQIFLGRALQMLGVNRVRLVIGQDEHRFAK